MRGVVLRLVALMALCAAHRAWAQPQPAAPDATEPPPVEPPPADEPPPDEAVPDTLHEDNEFGPVILIEQIDITGNTNTQTEVIRRALPIAVGDVLHASDKRLREARFKILALGYFRDVTLAMHKGSQRGQVIVEIHVVERGTLMLNHLWFGYTDVSRGWVGADLGERNLLGLGIAIGGGVIYARQGDVAGARAQWAAELRLADPSVRGTRWGVSWAGTLVHGSDPYRISGPPDSSASSHFQAFSYRRLGARVGATYDFSALTRFNMGLRAEEIDAELPDAPTRELPDGRIVGVDLHLAPGASRVFTVSFGFDRDTRPDPILPHAGSRILASAELGATLLGGSYDFATIFGHFEHYWPLFHDQHAIAIKVSGGVVVGDAPRFDRIHIADVDHMLTPRALGLVLSTAAPLSILGTRADKPEYGDLGGTAAAEYVVTLFKNSTRRQIYGADAFFGFGVWGLAERDDLRVRAGSLYDALPIDLFADAGVRIDTDIGTFELTIANALGRLR